MDWSKFWDAVKTFFSGGAVTWDKDNGWQTHSVGDVASAYTGSSDGNTVLGNLVNSYTGSGLTDAQNAANQFTADQAALQRDWSSQEAERARDWQEEMYAKYNSLSGKIAQAEEAGINPLFAVTGDAVSPMSTPGSVPSGSSASSVTPTGHGLTDLFGSIIGLIKAKSEVEVNQSIANKNNADAAGQLITNESLREMNSTQILESRSRIDYNVENSRLVASKILNTDADTQVKGAELGQIAASISNMNADTDVKVKQLAVMTSEIVKNTRSLDVMSAQIAEMASSVGLNKEKGKETAQIVRNLVQEYGHRGTMNAIEEVVSSRDSGEANGYYRSISEVKRFIDSLFGWFSGGASVSSSIVNKN